MFNPKFDFIVIGSATRDVFLKGTAENFEIRSHAHSPTGAEQCLPLGSKIEIKEIVFTTGGGGTNAAVTFARQGWKTTCVGVISSDFNGGEILRELRKERVDTRYFQKHHQDYTAYSVILVNPSGERTILSYKGEGQHFVLKDIPVRHWRARWLFLNSLGGHFDLLETIINYAQEKGIKLAMNPGGKELGYGLEKLGPMLKKLDIFIANKEETVGLLGLKPGFLEETARALKKIIPGIAVVTDGHNGVGVVDREGREYRAGVPDSPVVERTGAGDAWSAGFVSEYVRSGDIKKAIQFATANASSVVTKFGSKAGILKKGDCGPWPLVEVKS